MHNDTLYLYIGPTSYNLELNDFITPCTQVLPPVRRGDIQQLIEQESPSTIVIVDGTYHDFPAVSHVEIKNALSLGWQVWGLSSMGAIRASEMHAFGMQGYGSVFQQFVENEDLPDDYVALVHSTEAPWFPISEPLVHLELLLNDAVFLSILTPEICSQIMEELRNMWFGDRTTSYLKKRAHVLMNGQNHAISALLSQMDKYRLKSRDVVSFFREQPFLITRSSHEYPSN
jgi:hypothetical protein